MIDANWQTELVRQWCRQSRYTAIIMPSHSRYFGAVAAPMSDWKRKPGRRKGLNWVVAKNATWDTNFWKSFTRARLSIPHPGKGSLSIFGDKRTDHRMFIGHFFSETRTKVLSRGRTIKEWKIVPGAKNHCVLPARLQNLAPVDGGRGQAVVGGVEGAKPG